MNHCGTKTIETERLILRRLTLDDADAMFRNWASDPDVTRYLTWPAHESADITRMLLSAWVPEYEKAEYYQWGIEPKSLGEVIGTISVVHWNENTRAAYIGYCIGTPWWHQGIMTEAFRAVIDFLFDEVKCERIVAQYDTNNPHSSMVMKKCGMSFEGIMRRGGFNNQGICDLGQYAILRRDPRTI
ncbi:MAG: GNAT family N-acetyltransferase [Lachnospiraceae bacterium]|nr:GNAT family N-acetyltransferase [Lachnospiraceae bacterium]